jgi:myo-inositol-1(or 4)-monophosphatase
MYSITMMKTKDKDVLLKTAVIAARKAGTVIMRLIGKISSQDIDVKKASDYVTSVDRESEKIILSTIRKRFPDHLFLAEESVHEDESSGYRWIIDPLDGTTNYIHCYPAFAVSIALQYNMETILGVIYDPLRNELFSAINGEGAFLNGNRIQISKVRHMKYGLIATGFPFRSKEYTDNYLQLFRNIFNKVSDLRRGGSAALDLAYLASGRCDGFFELGLKPWDIAAGSILIREAGGKITDFSGGNNYLSTGNIVAGVPALHKELLREVRKIFNPNNADVVPKFI